MVMGLAARLPNTESFGAFRPVLIAGTGIELAAPTFGGAALDLVVDVVRPERDGLPLLALCLPGAGSRLATYRPIIDALTRRGHAVAVPRLSLADSRTRLDIVGLFAAIEARLGDHIGGRLGVIGHSLGSLHVVESLCTARTDEFPPAVLVSASDTATSAEAVERLAATSALLVVHSRDDILCSYTRGRRLYEMARGERVLVTLHGSDHGAGVSTMSSTLARRLVPALAVDFLESAVGRRVRSGARALMVEATRLGLVEATPSDNAPADPSSQPDTAPRPRFSMMKGRGNDAE